MTPPRMTSHCFRLRSEQLEEVRVIWETYQENECGVSSEDIRVRRAFRWIGTEIFEERSFEVNASADEKCIQSVCARGAAESAAAAASCAVCCCMLWPVSSDFVL